jgi:hypothetical protein
MAYSTEGSDENGYSVSEVDGFRLGDHVTFDGGEGCIEHLMTDGYLGLEGRPFSIEASEERPAALIRLYRGGKPSEYLVGKAVSDLSPDSGKRLGKNGRR